MNERLAKVGAFVVIIVTIVALTWAAQWVGCKLDPYSTTCHERHMQQVNPNYGG